MSIITATYDASTRGFAMAADRASTQDGVRIRSGRKIVELGAALVGVTGIRLWQRYLAEVEPLAPGADPVPWLHALADGWMAWARERGHGLVHEGTFQVDGCLLAATPAGLFVVSGTGDVIEVQEPYAAAGSGQPIALGAMHAVFDTGAGLALVARAGVLAAIAHDPWCGFEADLVTSYTKEG